VATPSTLHTQLQGERPIGVGPGFGDKRMAIQRCDACSTAERSPAARSFRGARD
jgi:hypothetical protein